MVLYRVMKKYEKYSAAQIEQTKQLMTENMPCISRSPMVGKIGLMSMQMYTF